MRGALDFSPDRRDIVSYAGRVRFYGGTRYGGGNVMWVLMEAGAIDVVDD
jgi:hypothetical protein